MFKGEAYRPYRLRYKHPTTLSLLTTTNITHHKKQVTKVAYILNISQIHFQ
ncbi:MAG: hypothetical protein LBH59_02780 [Planctomycetaceae bacterium]|nr:hypothetical protein [Planctomycetaceae bacterium]